MNKIITVIVGLAVLGGGAFWYMGNQDKKMSEAIKQLPTPTEQVTSTTNLFSLAQVAEHATRENCWLVLNDKVYNVTSFVDKHPGGDKILKGCGTDATELFGKIKAHAKSSVQALKEKFVIGSLQAVEVK
jgi:cytochrome b involved in lipid metabolism